MGSLLSNRAYDWAKWVLLVLVPAALTLYVSLGQTLDLPNVETVVSVVSLVAAFLGTMLGISSTAYQAKHNAVDGELLVQADEDGVYPSLKNTPVSSLLNKDTVTLKVERK